MTTISEITPKTKTRVIDLVSSLGIDTRSWADFKGGQARASTNPKYCYEWNFESEDGFVVVNFWTHQFTEADGKIEWSQDLKKFTETGNATQKARGRRLQAALKKAFELNEPLRVIICHGDRRKDGKSSSVIARGLDQEAWLVTSFDNVNDSVVVTRSANTIFKVDYQAVSQENIAEGFEGYELMRWFVKHRFREGRLRQQKIASALISGKGRLKCEVPRCGFDFAEKYGLLGKEFAHVHHLTAVGQYPQDGMTTKMSDLAIVCANCHAMIHRGGKCRQLVDLILVEPS